MTQRSAIQDQMSSLSTGATAVETQKWVEQVAASKKRYDAAEEKMAKAGKLDSNQVRIISMYCGNKRCAHMTEADFVNGSDSFPFNPVDVQPSYWLNNGSDCGDGTSTIPKVMVGAAPVTAGRTDCKETADPADCEDICNDFEECKGFVYTVGAACAGGSSVVGACVFRSSVSPVAAKPGTTCYIKQEVDFAELVKDACSLHDNYMTDLRELSSTKSMADLGTSGEMAAQLKEMHNKISDMSTQINDISATFAAASNKPSEKITGEQEVTEFFPSMPKSGPWARIMMKSQRYDESESSGLSTSYSYETKKVPDACVQVTTPTCNYYWYWHFGHYHLYYQSGCSYGCVYVDIPVEVTDAHICPTKLNKYNWLNQDTYDTEFSVTREAQKFKICKSPNNGYGWGFYPSFTCCAFKENTSQTESSEATSSHNISKSEFSIGFEVAKVTIGRGWFKPEFLEHSDLFMKFSNKNISNGRPTDDEWHSTSKMDFYRKALLPSYPVAFVIARDITIQITSKEIKKAAKDTLKKEYAAGSTKGFSSSGSYSGASTIKNGETSVGIKGDSLVIKIAGAQILMWIQNYINKDAAIQLGPRTNSTRSGYDVLDDLPEWEQAKAAAPSPSPVSP
eukprot:gb/GEZN01003836.1/.p1 GENE.gb/GEZN01003836.1/~~gb/GEZN01003836.1/.p1  ORF type:complete len:683 (+),score=87.27 gb/GEZN01003836.1/:184-2049(+)